MPRNCLAPDLNNSMNPYATVTLNPVRTHISMLRASRSPSVDKLWLAGRPDDRLTRRRLGSSGQQPV